MDVLSESDSEGPVRKTQSGGGRVASTGSIFIDIYGKNVPTRLNTLMEEVLAFAALVGSGANTTKNEEESSTSPNSPQVKAPLFWLDLLSFNNLYRIRERVCPKPDFTRKPIHGDLEYQTSYHHSFFHPQKDNIFGIKGFSVVDKFRDKQGWKTCIFVRDLRRSEDIIIFFRRCLCHSWGAA